MKKKTSTTNNFCILYLDVKLRSEEYFRGVGGCWEGDGGVGWGKGGRGVKNNQWKSFYAAHNHNNATSRYSDYPHPRTARHKTWGIFSIFVPVSGRPTCKSTEFLRHISLPQFPTRATRVDNRMKCSSDIVLLEVSSLLCQSRGGIWVIV